MVASEPLAVYHQIAGPLLHLPGASFSFREQYVLGTVFVITDHG